MLKAAHVAVRVTKCVGIVREVRDLVQCGAKNALYRILRTMVEV